MECVLRINGEQQKRGEESKAAPSRDSARPHGIVGAQTEHPCLKSYDGGAEPGIVERLGEKRREILYYTSGIRQEISEEIPTAVESREIIDNASTMI